MKYILSTILIGSFIVSVFLLSSYSSGSPDGYAGSPTNQSRNCTVCHGGEAIQLSGNITGSVFEQGYTPGEIYTINAVFAKPEILTAGFQMTTENEEGKISGEFIQTNNKTKISFFGRSVTHSYEGINLSNDSIIWSFDWKAPEEAEENIVFYAAFYGGGTTYICSDTIDLMNVGIENIHSRLKIYPNPAKDYIVIDNLPAIKTEAYIVNSEGKRIRNLQLHGDTKEQLNIDNLQKGVYFLSIPGLQLNKTFIKK